MSSQSLPHGKEAASMSSVSAGFGCRRRDGFQPQALSPQAPRGELVTRAVFLFFWPRVLVYVGGGKGDGVIGGLGRNELGQHNMCRGRA